MITMQSCETGHDISDSQATSHSPSLISSLQCWKQQMLRATLNFEGRSVVVIRLVTMSQAACHTVTGRVSHPNYGYAHNQQTECEGLQNKVTVTRTWVHVTLSPIDRLIYSNTSFHSMESTIETHTVISRFDSSFRPLSNRYYHSVSFVVMLQSHRSLNS